MPIVSSMDGYINSDTGQPATFEQYQTQESTTGDPNAYWNKLSGTGKNYVSLSDYLQFEGGKGMSDPVVAQAWKQGDLTNSKDDFLGQFGFLIPAMVMTAGAAGVFGGVGAGSLDLGATGAAGYDAALTGVGSNVGVDAATIGAGNVANTATLGEGLTNTIGTNTLSGGLTDAATGAANTVGTNTLSSQIAQAAAQSGLDPTKLSTVMQAINSGANPTSMMSQIAQYLGTDTATAGKLIGSLISGAASIGGALIQTGANNKAAAQTTAAGNTAIATQGNVLTQQQALQQPFISAGTSALGQYQAGTQPGGQFNTPFSTANMSNVMPAFTFADSQAQAAMNNQMAMGGQNLSSNAVQGAGTLAAGLAGQYENQAFNQYQTTNNDAASKLQTLVSGGQTATNQVGANLGTYGSNVGNITMAQGAANAGATLGNANAATGAVTALGNTAAQLATPMLSSGLTTGSSTTGTPTVIIGSSGIQGAANTANTNTLEQTLGNILGVSQPISA